MTTPMPDSPPVLRRMKRDVLTMLRVELRQAQAGETRIIERSGPVDRDYVEMLRETIAEIESRALAAIVPDPTNETQIAAIALAGFELERDHWATPDYSQHESRLREWARVTLGKLGGGG